MSERKTTKPKRPRGRPKKAVTQTKATASKKKPTKKPVVKKSECCDNTKGCCAPMLCICGVVRRVINFLKSLIGR